MASSVLNFADGLQIGTDRTMFLCIFAWHPSIVLHVQVPSDALKVLQAVTFPRTHAHWTQRAYFLVSRKFITLSQTKKLRGCTGKGLFLCYCQLYFNVYGSNSRAKIFCFVSVKLSLIFLLFFYNHPALSLSQ